MVRGVGIAVTAVYGTYQCADIDSTARGFAIDVPMLRQARVYALSARAFMGLPCPTKMAGKRETVLTAGLRNDSNGASIGTGAATIYGSQRMSLMTTR